MSAGTLDWKRRARDRITECWVLGVLGLALALFAVLAAHPQQACESWYLWLDNALVDLYTVFFWGAAATAYRLITQMNSVRIWLWRFALGLTILMAVLGGAVDHAENFCGLAKFSPTACSEGTVDRLTSWKWGLIGLNAVVAATWWAIWFVRWRAFRLALTSVKNKDWDAALVSHFIPRQAIGKRWFTYSFSHAAVMNFLSKFLEPGGGQNDIYSNAVSAFLDALSRRQGFGRSGNRIEILSGQVGAEANNLLVLLASVRLSIAPGAHSLITRKLSLMPATGRVQKQLRPASR